MNKILTLTEAQRKIVFEQTAVRIHLPVVAIEKDFWVTEILNILFSLPYAEKMVFKGGTSLISLYYQEKSTHISVMKYYWKSVPVHYLSPLLPLRLSLLLLRPFLISHQKMPQSKL